MSTRARLSVLTLAVCACLGLAACTTAEPAGPARASTPASTPLGIANESAGTPRPSSTPGPASTAASAPASTKPSGPLAVKFVSISSPVSRGGDGSATVQTAAGANCTLLVSLKSGPSKAQGLGATQADDSGVATWSWHIGLTTTRGSWPVTATCTNGAVTVTAKTTLIVQ